MASEYLKYLNRDVKPEAPPPELSPKEKRKNWWYYHWKLVLVIVIAAAAVLSMLLRNLGITEPLPDYQIAYIGSHSLSDETVEAITAEFQKYGTDTSGDETVTVVINQYIMYEDTQDYDSIKLTSASVTALEADIMTQTSYFFLLEDPASFTSDYQVLADQEGNFPEDIDHSWEDKVYALSDIVDGLSTQDANLYLGRRGFYDSDQTVKYKTSCDQLWDALLESMSTRKY